MHPASIFVTLTYDEEHVPDDGSINKRDPQLFLKRLRKRLAGENNGRTFRYYLCGEYGDLKGRPHYHAVLFGLSMLDGPTVARSWNLGHTQVGELTPGRVRYVAKYLQKKQIAKGQTHYEDGRLIEFALMSRGNGKSGTRGLGSGFLQRMAEALKRASTIPGVNLAGVVRLDGKRYPLDRYGRDFLASALVDMGLPWRDARDLVKHATSDNVDAAVGGVEPLSDVADRKYERQKRAEKVATGREKVSRTRRNRVH